MKTPKACGFLIVRGSTPQSFLLMRHRTRWDIPKGHVDPGESDIACALRELEEETGIGRRQIEVDPDFLYESRYQVKGKQYGLHDEFVEKTLLVFLGRLVSDVEIQVTEHEGYQWFPWNPPHSIQPQAIDPLLHFAEIYFRTSSDDD